MFLCVIIYEFFYSCFQFMDFTSLQATLPDPHVPAEYSGNLAESWISQNSTVPYIPSVPHGKPPLHSKLILTYK
jgi:hypothetical protein